MSKYDPAKDSKDSYDAAIDALRERLESFRCERIGDAVLYLGDCRKILPLLPKVDAVVTDPPYGLFFPYHGYFDSPQNLEALIPYLMASVFASKRSVITPGVTNIGKYPEPKWIGVWTWDTTNTFGMMGFNQWQPLLFYGEDVAGFGSVNGVLKSDRIHFSGGGLPTPHGDLAKRHSCPKPPDVMTRIVTRFTNANEEVLDPFMGSGTTGVACAKLGRKFIGIEMESKYFDIACRRIDEAYRQPRLFKDEPVQKPKQEELL